MKKRRTYEPIWLSLSKPRQEGKIWSQLLLDPSLSAEVREERGRGHLPRAGSYLRVLHARSAVVEYNTTGSGALDDTRETSPLRKLGKVFFQDPCWLFIPICVLYFAPAVRQCLKMKYVLQRLQKPFPPYTTLSRSLIIPQFRGGKTKVAR